ncbi:MAG: LacI family DNA-binding transcriptional regulator, partial [Chitinophagaceae bacterium]
MKAVSIKDIANRAGVSTTTVSFVLNGKAKEKRISNDLKDQILAIAAELNYRPNHVARGLRTGKTNTIGLMVEDISNPFFANLAKIIEDEADKVGYTVMFCSTENNDQRAGSLLHMLKHRQMDGFIITPTIGLERDVKQIVDEKRPLVLLDRYFPELDSDYVTIDNYKGSNDATKWLLERGCQKIGIVTLQSDLVQMSNRANGYFDALKDAGFQPEQEL